MKYIIFKPNSIIYLEINDYYILNILTYIKYKQLLLKKENY